MTDAVSDLIGETHLVLLEDFSRETGMRVYLKFEPSNPGGSIKDRAALSMIDAAEGRGQIVRGESVLIEPTSGNTGIGIAMIGAARGYRVILVMPESMSVERRALAAAYGAEVVLTPAGEGMAGAVAKAAELEDSLPGAWVVGQFVNPDNAAAHERTTGPEILAALGEAPAHVVAGVGTGGTITGVAHFLRSQGAKTHFHAVEPAESPIISQTLAGEAPTPGPHGIQGIGANFIPDVLDLAVLDDAIGVPTQEALQYARNLAATQGLLVGISTGANLAAVARLAAAAPQEHGTTVVTFAVDTGERYLSTSLFKEENDA